MDFSNRLIRDTLKYIPGIFLFLQAEFAIAEEFSIVVLPDTQFYSQNNPAIFNAQTQWIRTNLATENIIYVAHLGDIVDSFGCNGGPTEWGNADTAMDELDGAPTTADDIAYGVLPGNHDWDPTTPGGSTCDTTRNQYNANFGPGRYGSYYGGNQFSSATNNDNNYTLFSSPGGMEFIAINLAYAGLPTTTEDAVMTWADNLLKAHPNRLAIVTSHHVLNDNPTGGSCGSSDTFGPYGQLIWDSLRNNPNLIMVLGGHCQGEKWVTFTGGVGDRPGCLGDVHVLMSNYQFYNSEQSGYLRIMRFDTVARTIRVETHSPTLAGGGAAASITNPASMSNTSVSDFSLDYNAFVAQCADVSLVMDVSGSMNADSAAIAGSKLDALQNAVDLFIDQVALDGDHRLAMTQFNHGIVPFSVPEIPFTPIDSTGTTAAHQMVTSMGAGGATNIVGGLAGGVGKINVMSPNPRRVAVLFTDGKHNTPTTLSEAALRSDLVGEIDAVDSNMQLYSIGFGNSVNDGALIDASGDKGGWHVNEVDPIVVAKTFSLVAARVMDNQVLSDPVYLIKPGETQVHNVGVSRLDTDLTIAVHWDRFDPNTIRTKVVPPGGGGCAIASDAVVPDVKQAGGTNYRLVRINLPYACAGTAVHEGEWKVEMTAAKSDRKAERVDILVYADSAIKLQARVNRKEGKFDISALLEGKSLKDSTFTAYILQPIPDSGDSTDLDNRGSKSDTVVSLPVLALTPRNPIAISLTVTGRTVDSIEASGNFEPRLKGAYQIRVVADLIDSDAQKLRREALASVFNPEAGSFIARFWVPILVFLVALVVVFLTFRRIRQRV